MNGRLLLLLLALWALPAAGTRAETVVTAPAPGFILTRETRTQPAQRIAVLTVELDRAEVTAALGRDHVYARETTSAMAKRHGAFAAINADFTSTSGPWEGAPEGICVIDGVVHAAPKFRTAIGFAWDGTPRVGMWLNPGVWSWPSRVTINGQSHPIVLMNRDVNSGWIGLFTDSFRESGLSIGDEAYNDGVEVFVDPGGVVAEVRDRMPPAPIHAGWRVLAGRGAGRDWLLQHALAGRRVTVDLVSTPPWQDFRTIVGGGPRLLTGGVYTDDPLAPFPDGEDFSVSGYKRPYYSTAQPRSGAGISADGKRLILAVVDGRQAGATGMTLPEFAALLRDFGAADAVQFDSGGSATLVVDGEVVNTPSDGRERAICNALLVSPKGTREGTWRIR